MGAGELTVGRVVAGAVVAAGTLAMFHDGHWYIGETAHALVQLEDIQRAEFAVTAGPRRYTRPAIGGGSERRHGAPVWSRAPAATRSALSEPSRAGTAIAAAAAIAH